MDLLQIVCYATALIVPALAFRSAYLCWRNRALTISARYSYPVITALLCNMASFVHGWAEGDVEAMVISMYGSVVYIYCILTFLKLCTAEEMQYALKRLCFASCYLAVVIATSNLPGVGPFVCAVTGWAAGLAKLVTYVFSEVDMPHWALSLISVLHGVVWLARKLIKEDYIGASQSAVSAFCSWMLFLLSREWFF